MEKSIPSGVYYCRESDNFYRRDNLKGMGTPFYLEWRARWQEFPQAGDMDPDQGHRHDTRK